MKIGILGGTFDPVHNGHIGMLKAAQQELGLDLVLAVPAGNPYFKKKITPYSTRLFMTEAAIQDLHDVRFQTCRLEEDETKPTYTFETMERLKQEYQGAELYFLCGTDVFESMHSWRNPDRILELCILAVFNRGGQSAQKYAEHDRQNAFKNCFPHAKYCLMQAEIPAISSTFIREQVRAGNAVSDYVPLPVAQLIKQNSLYQE